jgi:hypothetical protein
MSQSEHFYEWTLVLTELSHYLGAVVGLVLSLTCPTVWLPILCEDQAGMDFPRLTRIRLACDIPEQSARVQSAVATPACWSKSM